MYGYECIARQLKEMGITHAFGLTSDDTLLLIGTLETVGIAYISARHETNAVAMAEGYAAATDKLGLAIIGRGPAMTNSIHGAAYAAKARSRVLILYGDAPINPGPMVWGPDVKTVDANAMLTSAGLKVFLAVTANSLPDVLIDAARVAMDGQPAALLLPTDVQRAELSTNDPVVKDIHAASPPARLPRPAAVKAAVDQIGKSKRPLIVAGIGAHRAGARDAIEALARRAGALIVTSAKAKDMFRGSPYYLGVLGSFSFAVTRLGAEQADCVIAFGAGLNRRTTSSGGAFPATAPIIQVDTDAAVIGRWLACDIAIAADARVAAEAMLAILPERNAKDKPFHAESMLNEIAQFDPQSEFRPAHTAHTVDPRALAIALDRLLPEKRNLVYDAGNFLGVYPYVAAPDAANIKLTVDFVSIGIGLGVAIGTSVARPDTVTVLFVGDGGFLMAMSEIETAARQNLPLIIVLMNDCAYGAEMHFLKLNQLSTASAVFPDIDFAAVAVQFGFEAHTVRSMSDLEALGDTLRGSSGPLLLDCKINPAVEAPFIAEPPGGVALPSDAHRL